MFTGGVFWFVMGILFVLVVVGAKLWAEDLGLKMAWWKWLLVLLWYGLLNLTLASSFTLWAEAETRAGTATLLFFGLITIIAGVGLWRLLWRDRQVAA